MRNRSRIQGHDRAWRFMCSVLLLAMWCDQAWAVAVKLSVAPLVAPADAWNYYNGLSMSHTSGAAAWTSEPLEIQELARALGYGISTYTQSNYASHVYEYIRNNIAIEFRFGLSKGARGALIDQSGTAFDQAHLMVELLKQGGVPASYKIGTITLTAAQFTAWTGISNAAAACQLLANGGIPGTVNGTTACSSFAAGTAITTISMGHIWVLALGQTYDPAYKIQIQKTGIDLAAAMGCGSASAPTCGTTILSPTTQLVPGITQTCGVTGVNCVTNVNQTGIEAQLSTYAKSLQTYISQFNTKNGTYLGVDDVVGGLSIDLMQSVSSGSLLPAATYPGTPQYSIAGDLPDAFRTTLTVKLDQINQLLFADETAGNRLRIWGYAAATDPSTVQTTVATRYVTLYSEYRPVATSTLANQTEPPATVTLSVNHPYAANGGTYADDRLQFLAQIMTADCDINTSSCNSRVWDMGVLTVVQGWGNQTQSTISHYGGLQSRDKFNGAPWENTSNAGWVWFTHFGKGGHCASRLSMTGLEAEVEPSDQNPCYGQQQGTLAANWLAQSARIRQLGGSINSVALQHHHSLGLVLSGESLGTGATVLSLQSMVSATSLSANAADQTVAFSGIASAMDRLEGGIEEQAFGTWEGGAGISMMVRSNANQIPFLEMTGANSGSLNTYLKSGHNWYAADLAGATTYANSDGGYSSVILPQNGYAGSFSFPNGFTFLFHTSLTEQSHTQDGLRRF